MALFGKREKAYEVWGDKPRWKEARQRLKDAGIKVMETGFYETEAPAAPSWTTGTSAPTGRSTG